MNWPPPSSIGWNPIDIDGIECLIGHVDDDVDELPWTVLRYDCEVGKAVSEFEAIELARESLSETPWLRGPKPTRFLTEAELGPPPPMEQRKDPAVKDMSVEQYTRAVRAEVISLLGFADADKPVDQWGEEFFEDHCETGRMFEFSVAFRAYQFALSLHIYEENQPVA